MSIDRNNNTPLYKQLEFLLQEKILLGDWTPGYLMPTEQQLCDNYGVSRITVRNALGILERKGLIERIQGRGSVVKRREIQFDYEISGFTKIVEARGYRSSTKIISKELIEARPEFASIFFEDSNQTGLLWKICSLRFLESDPAVVMYHYVSKDLGDQMLKYDLEKSSFYYLFELLTKLKIQEKRRMFTAVSAPPETAKMLNVEIGTPLIWSKSITYMEGCQAVELNYSFFVGYKFYFESGSLRPSDNSFQNYVKSAEILKLL
jgi:GntR family transcriptional regulator